MKKNYLTALFLNNLVFHMITVASGWVAYEQTENPLSLAMVGLMQFLPALLFFLPSGSAADHWDKRAIVAVASVMTALLSFALALTMSFQNPDVTKLYVVLFFYSSCRSLEATSMAAMVLELVQKGELSATVAKGSTVKQVSKILGPLLAGYLLSHKYSPQSVFYVIAAASMVSAVLILRTSLEARQPVHINLLESRGFQLFSGFRTIGQSPVLLGALSLDLLAGFFGGLLGLLPLVVSDILHGDAAMLGWLRASVAAGAILMSTLLGYYSIHKNLGSNLLASVLGLGVVICLAAITTDFLILCALLFVFGFADALSVHIRHNLIQLAAPSHNRGRVTAASQLFVVVSNQLSEVRAGLMVSLTGVASTVLLGGVAVTACALTWSHFFPALAKLNTFDDLS